MVRALPQFLAGALCAAVLAGCAMAPPPMAPPVANPHPAIAAAQAHIGRAIYILKYRTGHDFAGHKAAALRFLQGANRQLHEAMIDAGPP